jgi:hypothetical protein
MLGDFILVDNDAIFAGEVTGDKSVRNHNGKKYESGDTCHQRPRHKMAVVIIVMAALTMVEHFQCFVMTKKDVPDHFLESTEILLEFTGKPLLKYAVQKRK